MLRAVKVTRMSAWSITLRLVLMLVLALNGMASAVAGVRMAPGPDQAMQASAGVPANGNGSPSSTNCHGHALAGVAVGHHDHDHVTPGATHPDRDPIPPDGCKAGACQCACTHCTQLPAPVIAVAPPMFERLGTGSIPTSGYPAPALPSLIRPPIL